MRDLVQEFPSQLKEGISIGKGAELKPYDGEIKNVLICGSGGSGIGGSLYYSLVKDIVNVPVCINNTYGIPGWVSNETLVICCSYSGNTEETLSALALAQNKGAEIAIITSGGKLLELARENSYNAVVIPGGRPPRSAISYSLCQLFTLSDHYGITDSLLDEVSNVPDFLEKEVSGIKDLLSSDLIESLVSKVIVMHGDVAYGSVLERAKQQINENSKALAYFSVAPEMTHNEIVGWTEKHDNIAAISIQDKDLNYRTGHRLNYIERTIKPFADSYTVFNPKGDTLVKKIYYLILLFDWISVLIAEKKGIDPVEVNVITALKEELKTVE